MAAGESGRLCICSKTMMMLYPLMEAIRSGGDLRNTGGSDRHVKDIVCPDRCVMFRLAARRIGVENPFISKAFSQSEVER